jgi:DNA-binding NtrC family response regulator
MAALIYILDDDRTFSTLLKANLGRAGEFKVRAFNNPIECLEVMAEEAPDALLTDLRMPEMDGSEVARRVRETSPHLPIYVLTGASDVDSAIEAMKAGADEYFQKPVNVTEIATTLRRALAARPLLEEASSLRKERQQRYSVDALLGEHPLMQGLREFVRGVASAPTVSVLLLGESGVGKNLAARIIHHANPTVRGQFVELNCAALPEHLLEAELFGYMRGAFTDAKENKPGLVEIADGGTLFLDEIAELPLGLQVKLLNFLESRRYRRLGGTRELEVELRIVTATNRPLEELITQKSFRQDLFYRISVASHTLPPLRAIASDIPLIAGHFVTELALELAKDINGLTPEALDTLAGWRWPGNVRELHNVLERAMLFAKGRRLEATDLPAFSGADPAGSDDFRLRRDLTLREVEREYIRLTMEAYDDNVSAAADALGISRKNLWEKRKRHGLPT